MPVLLSMDYEISNDPSHKKNTNAITLRMRPKFIHIVIHFICFGKETWMKRKKIQWNEDFKSWKPKRRQSSIREQRPNFYTTFARVIYRILKLKLNMYYDRLHIFILILFLILQSLFFSIPLPKANRVGAFIITWFRRDYCYMENEVSKSSSSFTG